jgi:hypothetical protein
MFHTCNLINFYKFLMNILVFNLNIIIKHKPQMTNDAMSPTRG